MQIDLGTYDKETTAAGFQANMKFSPQNVDKLEAVFQEGLENALRGAFSLEEIAAARSGFLQSGQNGRGEDRAFASMMTESL